MDERTPAKRPRDYRVLGFVFVMFGLWLLFAILTEAVITCVPGGQSCIAWPLVDRLFGTQWAGLPRQMEMTRDWVVVVFGLAMAIWSASRIFFPPERFDPPARNGNKRESPSASEKTAA